MARGKHQPDGKGIGQPAYQGSHRLDPAVMTKSFFRRASLEMRRRRASKLRACLAGCGTLGGAFQGQDAATGATGLGAWPGAPQPERPKASGAGPGARQPEIRDVWRRHDRKWTTAQARV